MRLITFIILTLSFNVYSFNEEKVAIKFLEKEIEKEHQNIEKIVGLSKSLCEIYGDKFACTVMAKHCYQSKQKYPYSCRKKYSLKGISNKMCEDPKEHYYCDYQGFAQMALGNIKTANEIYSKHLIKSWHVTKQKHMTNTFLELLVEMKTIKDPNEDQVRKRNKKVESIQYICDRDSYKASAISCVYVSILNVKEGNIDLAKKNLDLAFKRGFRDYDFLSKDRITLDLRKNKDLLKMIGQMGSSLRVQKVSSSK